MTQFDESLGEGHFARKQIFCKDRLIAWAHRSRFEIGLELARDCAGQRVLDYGCGDGTFLALLMEQQAAPAVAIGAELGADGVRDCQARLGNKAGFQSGTVVWQVAQSMEKPSMLWSGLVVWL